MQLPVKMAQPGKKDFGMLDGVTAVAAKENYTAI